ncbi:uncharacterized protein PgNI_03454 [Pyricularia grisea]|uniref:Uncharacterized protein n=1 Tax=Pyricularia grisea TaxID=148305 RepID=A0A6P8BAE9_PYRGI|nr:uncharacterized protein PgNI_03454 [Pyricularia grisea]TLD12657.1 hypothetical protein PgNI_03454 [Pyricularia grisea]
MIVYLHTRPPKGLRDLERALQGFAIDNGATIADNDLVLALLDAPLAAVLVPEAGSILGLDVDLDRLLLARVELDLGKSLELLDGSVDARLLLGRDVDLNNLGTLDAARVGHGRLDGDEVAVLPDLQVAKGKRGVAETVTKGEQHGAVGGLVEAVADVDVLAVQGAGGLGPEVEEGRVVLQADGEGEGKLAAGVDVAKEHVGDGVARLVAAVPRLHDGGDIGVPGHLHGRARLHDDDRVIVGGGHSGDEVVHGGRELHVVAVVALGFPVGVEPAADDDLVRVPGQRRRLGDLLLGVDALASAHAQRALAERHALGRERRRRRAAVLELDVVLFALGQLVGALLLDGAGAEKGVTLALLGGVLLTITVDKKLARAADDDTKLPGAVLLGNEVALVVCVPRLGLELGVVVVDKEVVGLCKGELVCAHAVGIGRRLVEDAHRHAGLALGGLGGATQHGQHLVRVGTDGELGLLAELGLDAVEGCDGVEGQERGRAAAVHLRVGANATKQGCRLRGVLVRRLRAVLLDAGGGALVDELEHGAGTLVEDMLADLVGVDAELEEVATEARRAGHLEVETGVGGLGGGVGAVPIAHDHAVPAPLLPQHVVQQLGVLAAVGAVDAVVGRHEGGRVGVAHGDLEGQGVDLTEGALRQYALDGVATVLLVVAYKVLDGGLDAGALDATHDGGSAEPGQHRVLAQRLEPTAAERATLHVDGGAEDGVGALCLGVLTHLAAGLF